MMSNTSHPKKKVHKCLKVPATGPLYSSTVAIWLCLGNKTIWLGLETMVLWVKGGLAYGDTWESPVGQWAWPWENKKSGGKTSITTANSIVVCWGAGSDGYCCNRLYLWSSITAYAQGRTGHLCVLENHTTAGTPGWQAAATQSSSVFCFFSLFHTPDQ